MSDRETFKKGQIVPRRLRLVLTGDKKAQHTVTFGCDVEVFGRTVRATSEGVVIQGGRVGRRMGNGTYKMVSVVIRNVSVVGYKPAGDSCAAKHELLGAINYIERSMQR